MVEFEVSTEAFSPAAVSASGIPPEATFSTAAAAAADLAGAAAVLASSDTATPAGGTAPATAVSDETVAPPAANGKVQVLITFTSSYDGWGQARVSCVSGGCTCTSQVRERERESAARCGHQDLLDDPRPLSSFSPLPLPLMLILLYDPPPFPSP